MAKHANPALVGSFVVGAVALALGGVLAFGSTSFLREQRLFIAYFDSSVEGLDVGAPIKFRGVQVGAVTHIHAVWDSAAETIRIPVELNFTEVLDGAEEFSQLPPEEGMAELVDLGLRAVLRTESFVTGQLFVELDFHPDTPARYVGGTTLPELPTIESGLAKLIRTLEDLPIEEIAEGANAMFREAQTLVSDPELHAVAQNLNHTMDDVRSLLRKLEGELEPLSTSAQLTMTDARTVLQTVNDVLEPFSTSLDATMEAMRGLIARLDDAAGGDYTLMFEIQDLLTDARHAAQSLQALSDYLQQRPEALLTGKK